MSNNVIAEIQELIQQIKKEYKEGADFSFVAKDLIERASGGVRIKILSPRLKKFCRKSFNFPPNAADFNLDYEKGDQEGNDFYYRVYTDNDDYDVLDYGKEEIYRHNNNTKEPKKCKVCGEFDSYWDGRVVMWGGRKVSGFRNPSPNIIAYFHPVCAKKYFAGKEQSSENNTRIKKKLLLNLDKISIEQCGYLINAELVKNYEEVEWYFRKGIFGDDNNPKWKAWWDKVQKVEIEGEEINLDQLLSEDYWEVLRALISEIKQNPSEWKIEEKKHTHWTEKMIRHQNSGQCHWKSLSNAKDWAEIEALVSGSKIPDKNDKPNNFELENLKKIFEEHNIRKITFGNGKLTIKYNKANPLKKVNNQQFKELEKYCQERNEHEIDQQRLGISSNNTSSEQNKDNHQLATGLVVGASVVLAVGILVYLVRKKKKN